MLDCGECSGHSSSAADVSEIFSSSVQISKQFARVAFSPVSDHMSRPNLVFFSLSWAYITCMLGGRGGGECIMGTYDNVIDPISLIPCH